MILSQTPYPPWRGLAVSLLLHAGLLGGIGSWTLASGDETAAPALVELVSLPEATAGAPSAPAASSASPVPPPPTVTPSPAPSPAQAARPLRRSRPVAAVANSPAPVPDEAGAATGAPDGGAAAPAAAGDRAVADAGAGEGGGTAGAAGRAQVSAPSSSDPVAMAGNPPPLYPMSARRMGREGRTVLLVTLSAAGECVEVRVEESSGTPSLDEAAVSAVKTWRFHPAIRNSAPVAATLRVPVQFSLNSGNSGLSGLPVVGQR